jgi:hypothetical protein
LWLSALTTPKGMTLSKEHEGDTKLAQLF